MIEEFNNYVSNYNMDDKKIRLKYNHCHRVMRLSRKYAIKLGFNKEDIELATVIGLLHDIGRFEQIRIYNSFNDLETIDHADYSIEQLFNNNLIERFWNKKEDYEIIKFAIKNHNKKSIPYNDNSRMLMHAKLIRDVDKMDIFYLVGVLDETKTRATNDEISINIKKDILNHKSCDRKDCKNNNDSIALEFAFAFDINYDECINEIKNNLDAYYNTIGRKDIFKPIIDEVNDYLDERNEKNVR